VIGGDMSCGDFERLLVAVIEMSRGPSFTYESTESFFPAGTSMVFENFPPLGTWTNSVLSFRIKISGAVPPYILGRLLSEMNSKSFAGVSADPKIYDI
jgi:hypothetical protein